MNKKTKKAAKKPKEYIIETRSVNKIYNPGEESELHVLKNVNAKFGKGEFIAILGPSGSGKTTLLDMIGCLLKPTSGQIFINGDDVTRLGDRRLAKIRGEKIGFIFQQYNLIHSLTALENVELGLRIMSKSKFQAKERAKHLLNLVGLGERFTHLPSRLSGGEQQRVAIARALANDPEIILGDEPTGNLDTKTGDKILNLLKELNENKGYTVIVVTHDPDIKEYSDRVINIRDGKIVKEELR